MANETPRIWTTETFTAHYGFSPQAFFDAEVRGLASGWRLPGFDDEATKAEIELAAIPDPQIIPPAGNEIDPKTGLRVEPELNGWTHNAAIARRATLETLINQRRELDIPADEDTQKHAQDFLDGTIDDYAPFLTPQSRVLADAGLIDTTKRPE